jgi:geranylgeranyl pyrophosphate synthase
MKAFSDACEKSWLEKVQKRLSRLDVSIDAHRSLPEISDLLNSQVLSSGKQFRARLFLLNASWLGAEIEQALHFARIIELTHSATLVHDDVIDHAPLRRGKPSINFLKSNTAAVLCGDYLIAHVMREMAEAGRLDLLKDLSQIVQELVMGQYMEAESQGKIHTRWDRQEEIARLKTGSLLRSCFTMPARLANRSEDEINRLARAGEMLGVAFQMIDDCLDCEGSSLKPQYQDIHQGLMNFVAVQLLQNQPELHDSLEESWRQSGTPLSSELLSGLGTACQQVRLAAHSRIQKALLLVESVPCSGDSLTERNSLREIFGDLLKQEK